MKKRVGTGYLLSAILPIVSVLTLALRLFSPHTRYAAVFIYLIGCGVLLLTARHHERVRRRLTSAKSKVRESFEELGLLRKRALLSGTVFATSLVLFPLVMPVDSLQAFRTPLSQHQKSSQQDQAALRHLQVQLTRTEAELIRALSGLRMDDNRSRSLVRSTWASYVDVVAGLREVYLRQRYFYQVALRSSEQADQEFLLAYTALCLAISSGQRILPLTKTRRSTETFLNEGAPEFGIQQRSYHWWSSFVSSSAQLTRLQLGRTYLVALRRLKPHIPGSNEALQLADATILEMGIEPQGLIDVPFDSLEEKIEQIWLPVQKGLAEKISPVRTQHRENFITPAQLNEVQPELQPGDILVQRRNWYLTNVGIPGFWPHAALYLGTPEEVDGHFSGPERQVIGGTLPSAFIRKSFPQAYLTWSGLDEEDHQRRVIEAIGEGVVLQSLEHSGHADYMAALRPHLSKSARLAALVTAFSHFGKPYDYNFEFSTDDSLVCSELVYKALAPSSNNPGIVFELAVQNGRFLLPPNDIVRTFDKQWGTKEQQLDFVFFLDGSEALRSARFASAEDLRASWRRPKWDMAQE